MKITHNFSNFSTTKKTIITIGTFDGVHIGHQKIIEQLVAASKKKNQASVLLTFFPHPRMVLQKESNIKLINTIDEKAKLLEKLELEELIIHPFNHDFSRLTAFEFVRDVLVEKLAVSKLVIGYDHHFGKNREGNFEQLKEYASIFDFELEEIPAQSLNDISVSSTKIRKALENGEIEKANKYLGYSYAIFGNVGRGDNIGTKIGYPTANINIKEDYKLIPKFGAYVVKSTIDNIEYFGMMNIGIRPTLNSKNTTIEVNFFNFDDNLYGKNLNIEFITFLREEQKFDSLETLKTQLQQDKIAAQNIISQLA